MRQYWSPQDDPDLNTCQSYHQPLLHQVTRTPDIQTNENKRKSPYLELIVSKHIRDLNICPLLPRPPSLIFSQHLWQSHSLVAWLLAASSLPLTLFNKH